MTETVKSKAWPKEEKKIHGNSGISKGKVPRGIGEEIRSAASPITMIIANYLAKKGI